VRVHVAFTPADALQPPNRPPPSLAVVVDVMRATSTIAQALASGYPAVYCCATPDDARGLRERLGEGLLGGERKAVKIEGFDVGASPREFVEARAETLILSTTNGTRAILAAASTCDAVILGGLLNASAVARAALEADGDVAIVCAGYKGAFALDDAYCAGRILERLGGEPTDAAVAAQLVARAYPDPLAGLHARTYGPPGLEEDIAFCAREDVLGVVPRVARMVGTAAEIVLAEAAVPT
jgi:2-phosphosulfolactate phosphatase